MDFIFSKFSGHNNVVLVKEENFSDIGQKKVSVLNVENDNFDVEITPSKTDAILYKLFLKENCELCDVGFDVIFESDCIIFKLKAKKGNVSGVLKIEIPDCIELFNVNVVNGDIEFSDVRFKNSSMACVNGDLNIRLLKDNDYKICASVVNGDLKKSVKSDEQSDRSLTCSSVNGDIVIE